MKELQVVLFGKFHVISKTNEIIKIDARKAQELLCYLLLFRHQPHSRDVIAEILWKDNPTDQSRSYLRRTLWQLQNTLEQHAGHFEQPLLLVDQDWLQLNPQVTLWIDVAIFERAYTTVRGIQGEDLSEHAMHLLKAAAELYQGNLLEGWYRNWCIFERERLLHIYLILLDKLIRYCETHGLYEVGIEYGMRALRQDRAREQSHRQLMRLHCLLRDRSGALRQYEWCVTALREELGVEPTKRTQALYQQIKLDLPDTVYYHKQEQTHNETLDQPVLQPTISELKCIRDEISLLSARVDHVILAAENGSR